MNPNEIAELKTRLEAEKQKLLSELKELGRINPANPKDWEATYSDMNAKIGADETGAEPDDVDQADQIEEYEIRNAEEVAIEARYNNVLAALQRINDGTYGTCLHGGSAHPIEKERLEANPAADTCIKHI